MAGDVTAAEAGNTGGAAFSPTAPLNYRQAFTVPAGTTLTRVDLRSSNPDGDDLDLFVTNSAGTVVASAASGAANELITSYNFSAGAYTIHVQAWAVEGAAPVASFGVRTFTVGDSPVDNLTVEPDSTQVTTGQPVTLQGNLTGITPGTPYLGWLGFNDGTNEVARTIVSID